MWERQRVQNNESKKQPKGQRESHHQSERKRNNKPEAEMRKQGNKTSLTWTCMAIIKYL